MTVIKKFILRGIAGMVVAVIFVVSIFLYIQISLNTPVVEEEVLESAV